MLALSSLVVTPLELYGSRGYHVKPFISRNGPLQETKQIAQAVRERKAVYSMKKIILKTYILLESLIR